jgi:hypothetical protein
MKSKTTLILLLTSVFCTFVTGCGNSTDSSDNSNTSSAIAESAGTEEKEAVQLLADLNGSYQQLWDVILADEYDDIWLADSAEFVGEENAQTMADKLAYMVSADIYGEEAVQAYSADPGSMAYDCSFTEDLEILTFDGSTISGKDSDGNELFSHTYHFIGMEDIRGMYEYESDDSDSGEFTYFVIAPDTSDTTYHIEFRYGSDIDALESYDSGKYAYWMASGISTEYDKEMIENCIYLYCEENLTE